MPIKKAKFSLDGPLEHVIFFENRENATQWLQEAQLPLSVDKSKAKIESVDRRTKEVAVKIPTENMISHEDLIIFVGTLSFGNMKYGDFSYDIMSLGEKKKSNASI